jgi:hypothetical protein
MSALWGRLSDLAEQANDMIDEHVAPLLDDFESDDDEISGGEEVNVGAEEEADQTTFARENVILQNISAGDLSLPGSDGLGQGSTHPQQSVDQSMGEVGHLENTGIDKEGIGNLVQEDCMDYAQDVDSLSQSYEAGSTLAAHEQKQSKSTQRAAGDDRRPAGLDQLSVQPPPMAATNSQRTVPATPPAVRKALKHAETTATTAIEAQIAMANRCAAAEEHIADLQSEVWKMRRREQEYEDGQRDLQRAHQRIEELKQVISGLKNNATKASKEAEVAKVRAEEYARELGRVRLEMESVHSTTSQASGESALVIQQLQSRVSQLEIVEQSSRALESDYLGMKADLNMKEEDLKRTNEELENLRGVLEGFSTELSETRNANTTEIIKIRSSAKLERERLQSELDAISKSWEKKFCDVNEARKMLESQVVVKEDALRSSVAEQAKLQRALQRAAENLSFQANEELVDRRLVNKLLTSFLDGNAKFQQEVLDLMSNILGFTEEEKARVGVGRQDIVNGGRKGSWWSASDTSAKKHQIDAAKVANLDDLWRSYLLDDDDDD